MWDHLPQEVLFHPHAADVRHGRKHRIQNASVPPLVAAHLLWSVANCAAGTQNGLHLCDALGLLADDRPSQVAYRPAVNVVQNIFAHLHRRPVVGNHLRDKIPGNTLRPRCCGHLPFHLI